MIIAEKPYISDFLIDSVEKLQIPILKTEELEKKLAINKNNRKLNIVDDISAVRFCSQSDNFMLYTNSESSFDWISKNLSSFDVVENINLFKNKVEFRELIKTVYPEFFYKKLSYEELFNVDISSFPEKFVIKPNVGFLSLGVHTVKNKSEWQTTLDKIKSEIHLLDTEYSDVVVNSSDFIVEELISGKEYAVDVYFNKIGKPVILNIFEHPFLDEDDVSDRIYITSSSIIKDNYEQINQLLISIGKEANLKNFPMHIELRRNLKGFIPIEVNPMRFAGWCTTDVAKYAYDINVYEYYFKQKEPDWDYIFNKNDQYFYYFSMAEVPSNIDKKKIKSFNYELFCRNYSNILEFRKVDFSCNPVFAVIFGKTDKYSEISNILKLKTCDYVEL